MKGIQIDPPPQKKLLSKSPALFELKISQNSQENTSASKGLLKACNFFKIETVTQVFSSEFWKIFKIAFLHNTSGWLLLPLKWLPRMLLLYLCY